MEIMTTEELTKMLGLKSQRTIANWLYNGTMPRTTVVKIGNTIRFSKEKVNEWLETRLQEQPPKKREYKKN